MLNTKLALERLSSLESFIVKQDELSEKSIFIILFLGRLAPVQSRGSDLIV